MSRIIRNAALILVLSCASLPWAWADPTPPIMPQIAETPLPPPVTLPAPASMPTDVPTTPLTATEAAQIALLRQPSMIVAGSTVAAAQARARQAQAGLRHNISLNAGYTSVPVTGGNGGGSEGFSSGVTLKQLLFDYDHTRALVRQAAAQQQSAQAGLTRAQSDLVFQVKQAYYSYVQALRLASVNEANLRNRQEHLAQAQARVKAGIGLPIDVVRAETAVNEATLNLTQARNTAAVARVTLAQLMGLDPRTPIQAGEADEPAQAMDDVNGLLDAALRQRPEIRQAQATLLASEHGLAAVKTANAPAYSGTAGVGVKGNSFLPGDSFLSLGVAVQWSAYDAGLTKARVAEADAVRASADAQLQIATLAVQTDVSQAYLNALTAEQRVTTAAAGILNAQEAVRLAQGRYNAGLGTFLDVLDAQNALVTAQTNRVNAQSAVNQARAALAHALNNDPAMPAAAP